MNTKATRRLMDVTSLCGAALIIATAAYADTTPAPATPATTAPAAPAAAPATPPPAYGKLTVTGLFDGYYQVAFSKQKSAAAGADAASLASSPSASSFGNVPLAYAYVKSGGVFGGGYGAGALYTVNQATPTLSLAEANLTVLAAPGGFGWKATLGAGDTADFGNVVPGGSEQRYKNFLQLYGTYAFAGTAGGALDFGKFYTPFGYEVTESNANFNYTRSTTYQLLPAYHTGFRLTLPSEKGFTVAGYLVNALYNSAYEGVSSENSSPAVIGQIAYADPANKYNLVETIGGGTDRPYGYDVKSTLSDTDLTFNLSTADTLGLNYTYLNQKPSLPGAAGLASEKTVTSGYGIYFKKQLNPINAIALRYDGYQAKTDAGNGLSSAQYKPYDITATYEIKSSTQWLTRLEYRYDGANVAVYTDSDGNVTKKNQSELIASEVFTF
ncbi:MAG: outer membrane beta-barrel protein [Capsulimonadaceae bacterium]|nr:outer membrane beta-barrel protein [Capsulimonadaceae bacterium]